MTHMGLLLLKLRNVELESRTESRLLIANWYIFSEKLSKTWLWTVTTGKWLVVRWRRSDVFNVIFEINRHLFLVFLLLTLNTVFFWLQSVTKIIGKTAIWVTSCFYPLPSFNNVKKQRAKLTSSYVMGFPTLYRGIGGFLNIIFKTPIIFCH